ncbi:MAG: hypothetical protein NTY77_09685 [Elusimicrobia bacterium]|nr:hypothetical protein [Elusimicrobiota bacterium]
MSLLLERARAWRGQRARALLCEGGGRLLAWSLAALSAALWLDQIILLPQAARAVVWLAGLAAVLAGAWVLLWRPWRLNLWLTVLDGAALEFPGLRQHLIPAWELRRTPPAHTSPQLTRAHVEATERLLAALPDRPAFQWRPSTHLRRVAAAALLGVLTWPWLAKASWPRVLAPWRDVALEAFLSVQPGDSVWSLGQPAEVSVRLLGTAGGPRRAAETRLWLRTVGPWSLVPWERQFPQGASFTVASVAEPLQYRLTWRGLESRVYRLSPESVPQLESLQARLAGLAAVVPLSGAEPLAARRGTWVRISGRPNQPLAKAVLRAAFLPAPAPMNCPPAAACEAGFTAQDDGSFQFDLETADGRRDPAPIVYSLRVVPDEPPVAQLLSPIQPVQADPSDSLPVAYAARDDSALSRVALLVRVPGQPPKELALRRFGREAPKESIGDYPWPLSGLPVGAKIAFQIKAYDDAVPPQTGLSEPGLVEIVDFAAGHLAAQRSWRRAEAALGALASREETLRDLYAAGEFEGARQRLSGLPEAWKDAAAAAEELARAMDRDAYANPGLREEVSGLADRLKDSAGRDLPAALAADRVSDAAAARARHARLAAAARRAERLLKNGRPLQDLQDFYMQAGRMSQDGEQLAAELESLSGSRKGRPSAEALRQVQEALKSLQERMDRLQKSIAALPQAQPGGAEDKSRRSYSMPLLAAQTSADALQAALRAGDYAAAAAIAKELAAQLAAIENAVTAAAAAGAAGAAPRQGSARLERLQARWSEVVEGQTRLAEKSQSLEERRRQRFVAAQKDLLAKLAADESVLLSSAAAYGEAFPAEVPPMMKALRDEFASGRVSRAGSLVAAAVFSLRASARLPSGRAGHGAAMQSFASAQEEIGRRLDEAPASPPPSGPDDETAAAARRQAEVRSQTAGLQHELESLVEDLGAAPPEAAAKLEAAQGEQGSAEKDLGGGDSASALSHQEKALQLLEQGGQDLQRSAAAQKQIEIGINAGFSQPAGGVRSMSGGGGMGARVEFVPLPKAKDYLPPKELREELERSLREKRPASYDEVIKEYFKRISQ